MHGSPVAVKLLVSLHDTSANEEAGSTEPPPPPSPRPGPLSAIDGASSPSHHNNQIAQVQRAAQVQQEVAALCRLRHPGIVRLVGISRGLAPPASPRGAEPQRPGSGGQQGQDKKGQPFLVYELVTGGTLGAAICPAGDAGDHPPAGVEAAPAAQHALALADVLAVS
jgi:serine/threonine protein kinase